MSKAHRSTQYSRASKPLLARLQDNPFVQRTFTEPIAFSNKDTLYAATPSSASPMTLGPRKSNSAFQGLPRVRT